VGNEGKDRLMGNNSTQSDGADSINAGQGCDGVSGNDGADVIHGAEDNDTPYTGYGGCTAGQWGLGAGLYGDPGADDIYGDNGNDYIAGGDGTNDYGNGGGGASDVCHAASTETVVNCEILI
jgi:hypothetical protein